MDAGIQKKIEELTISVEQRSIRYRRSMILTGIIYGILVVFVFGYTSYIYRQITELSTPENLSQFMVNSVRAQFPSVREGAKKQMQPLASAIAREVVSGGLGMIPSAGAYARAVIDEQIDAVLDEFEKKDMPVIEAALDQAVTEVLAKNEIKDSDALSQAITKRVSAKIGEELDKIVNGEFYASVGKLETDLDKLRTKEAKSLTSRDFAERQFIFCWLRLNDIADLGTKETSFLSTVSGLTSSLSKNLAKEIAE